ncbi:hypothetical protein LTR66_014320, partial [Elasticomyces elasticus]
PQDPRVDQSQNNVHFTHQPRRPASGESSASTSLTEAIREQWQAIDNLDHNRFSSPTKSQAQLETGPSAANSKSSRPPVHDSTQSLPVTPIRKAPPPSPQHRSNVTILSSLPSSPVPPSTPRRFSFEQQTPDNTSPLKHQYRPSTSSSESESDDDTDATSDTDHEELGSELKDQATPLVRVGLGERKFSGERRPLPSIPSSGSRTLQPSDSASQGAYRKASSPSAYSAGKKRRAIATVCSWSDRGIWEPIQDDECSIIILPGLVQIHALNAEHSRPLPGATWQENSLTHKTRPLVEFELTPVVPLRKGTALDITIRSPPTSNSSLQTTNNVMFRSRNLQECEKLYQLINWARCNNPTYARLAQDRARQPQVTFATDVQPTKSKSWFSFGSREKTSYRASSRPPASIADTGTSGASTGSAFSALRRFGKNSPFSLQRSSVVHKPGYTAPDTNSLYSSGNDTGSGSGSSTPAPSQKGYIPGREGPNVPQTSAEAANGGGMVNNMKVRLFVRKGVKWDAVGQCLLTVLPAVTHNTATGSRPSSPVNNMDGTATPPGDTTPTKRPPSAMPSPIYANHQRGPSQSRSKSHGRSPSQSYRMASADHTPHRIHGDGREKRILLVSAKNKAHVLLDELLAESCFEKVMQTGIAVNVWKEDTGIRSTGGVVGGKNQMYMIQFMSGIEAGWVFGLVGGIR